MQGVVKTFLPGKKYGFIKGDDGKDYFFHASAFKDKQQVEKICEEVRVDFEQVATPKGYQAKQCSLVNIEATKTFILPNKHMESRTNEVKGWETIVDGEWMVHACSRDSPDVAKKQLIERTLQVGANALLAVEYYKEMGSEPGTGDGIYNFTIHCFRGRIAVIAKRNALGTCRFDDFSKINDNAIYLKKSWRKLFKKTKRRQHRCRYILLLIILASPFALFPNHPNFFVGLIVLSIVIDKVFCPIPSEEGSWLEKDHKR